MRPLFLVVLVAVYSGECRPQDSFADAEKQLLSPHFRPLDDYKNVNLPNQPPFTVNDDNPNQFILNNDGSGNYNFSFNTVELQRVEQGELRNEGTENEAQVVKGQYTVAHEYTEQGINVLRTIGYVADENGFQPFLINVIVGRISPKPAIPVTPTPPPYRPPSPPPRTPPPYRPPPQTPPPSPTRRPVGAPQGKGIGSLSLCLEFGGC